MKGFLDKLFGDEGKKYLKSIAPLIERINNLESNVTDLPDDVFPQKTAELKARLENGETTDDILPEAFALVREAAKRTLGQRHYDVQLIGGIVLHQGKIAEMRTGEGKTLVATLPAYLNALSGKGVHVVTVNDYLARRDAQWMGQIYAFLGLSVGIINDNNQSYVYDASHIQNEEAADETRDELGSFKVVYEFLKPCSKRDAYAADITYGTNSQFGFDYLRDNTVYEPSQLSQRGHHYVIIDEVDSILIDEARVPLILSSQGDTPAELYANFAKIARTMEVDTDFTVDEKMRAISLTEKGIEKAERALGVENLYTDTSIVLVHHLESAIRAKALFLKDRDYVVREGEAIIVDPFTGRMQEGRRYSDGLHQAIEAKEGLTVKAEARTIASITYQNYFKFYSKYSGMTGTGKTSEEEFLKVYGLEVIEIPTHRGVARIDNTDLIFQNEQGKFKALAKKVKELQEKGQPVLIGTISIEKNELLSAYLTEAGVQHQVLNAKNHELEGEIVAQSGRKGSVVVATNMAGRGVDIKLGGVPFDKEKEAEVKELGGLHVIGTERHDARRIDNQLRGRSGRQGDPGETQFYVSLDDPLMKIFGGDRVKGMIGKLGMAEEEAIKNSFISNSLEKAQEKIEGFNFDARKHVLSYDDVMSYHRTLVYKRRREILFSNEAVITEIINEATALIPEGEAVVKEKQAVMGTEKFIAALRPAMLQLTDLLWMEHLEVMDATRQSVNLRSYGQREPLVEYKRESLRLFREMERSYSERLANFIMNMNPDDYTDEARAQRQSGEMPPIMDLKMGRNDKVTVKKDGKTEDIKFKNLEKYLQDGWKLMQ